MYHDGQLGGKSSYLLALRLRLDSANFGRRNIETKFFSVTKFENFGYFFVNTWIDSRGFSISHWLKKLCFDGDNFHWVSGALSFFWVFVSCWCVYLCSCLFFSLLYQFQKFATIISQVLKYIFVSKMESENRPFFNNDYTHLGGRSNSVRPIEIA